MNCVVLPSSPILQLPTYCSSTRHQLQPRYISTGSIKQHVHPFSSFSLSLSSHSTYFSCARPSFIRATTSSDEGTISVIDFEDFIEKDWSFLDPDESKSDEQKQKIGRIISAGGIQENSRVLVSIGSEGFVDQLVETSPCSLLLVAHDSLFLLAGIKEKYDKVKCWQGELIYVPEKWAPFDVVFLYFLPALPFKIEQIFEALANCCSPGARLVISHPQGRKILEQERKQYQDVIISDLPDKMTLQKVAEDHCFELVDFVDEPEFYLAVLQFSETRRK